MISLWRESLLSLYYFGSYPLRARQNARLLAERRAPVIVLFYHRIADDRANPWTASNRTFAAQVAWLKRHFDMVSLAEAQRRIRSGSNGRPSIAITFDDGYADNCERALPLLVDQGIPCTYFVTAQNVFENVPFPHDAARGRPLAPNTVRQLRDMVRAGIEIGAHTRTHPDLAQVIYQDQLYDEVVAARKELESAVGAPVRYFAFPFGQHINLNPEVFHLARSAGYEGVCSAYGGYNFPGDDAFHLQRIHADDDMIRLKNWVTLDPRKLRQVRRYEYDLQHSTDFAEPAGARP